MKTSNKILWGGLIVVLLFITTLIIMINVHYKKELKDVKNSLVNETRGVKSFRALHIRGNLMIKFRNDSEQKVRIKADREYIGHIKTYVKEGCLYVTTDLDEVHSKLQEVFIKTDTLNALTMEGKGLFTGNFSTEQIKVDIQDESHAKLIGKADRIEIICSGEGRVYGDSFETKTCKVEAKENALVRIKVTEKLDINATGDSYVNYTGNPDKASINTLDNAKAIGE